IETRRRPNRPGREGDPREPARARARDGLLPDPRHPARRTVPGRAGRRHGRAHAGLGHRPPGVPGRPARRVARQAAAPVRPALGRARGRRRVAAAGRVGRERPDGARPGAAALDARGGGVIRLVGDTRRLPEVLADAVEDGVLPVDVLVDGFPAIVTSPPYNVAIPDYPSGYRDHLPWPVYEAHARLWAAAMAKVLAPGGRQ